VFGLSSSRVRAQWANDMIGLWYARWRDGRSAGPITADRALCTGPSLGSVVRFLGGVAQRGVGVLPSLLELDFRRRVPVRLG